MKKILFLMTALSILSFGATGTVEGGKNATGTVTIPVTATVNILHEDVTFKVVTANDEDVTSINLNHSEIKNGTLWTEIPDNQKEVTQKFKVEQTTAGNYNSGEISLTLDNAEDLTFTEVGDLTTTLSTNVDKAAISKDEEATFTVTSTLSHKSTPENGGTIYETVGEHTTDSKDLIVTYTKNSDY